MQSNTSFRLLATLVKLSSRKTLFADVPNCCEVHSIWILSHNYIIKCYTLCCNLRKIMYALQCVGCPSITLNSAYVSYIYEGKDAFLWLPTSFGNTICYEVLPFVFDVKLGPVGSLVVVVSLFLSLTIDKFVA